MKEPESDTSCGSFEAHPAGLSAVAVLDAPRDFLVVSQATGTLVQVPAGEPGSVGPRWDLAVNLADVGAGAEGMVVSSEGRRVYVLDVFTAEITEVVLPRLSGSKPGIARFDAGPKGAVPDNVRLGRELFTTSTSPAMSAGVLACATCHPEGRPDGLTWVFGDQLRNTPSLVGRISETAPFHWAGDLADPGALDRATIQTVMGGQGPSETERAALFAFLDTLPVPPAPSLDVDAVERGRLVFFDEVVGCATCHAGAHYTDNQNHELYGSRFQTPVLHGLARSEPYLHDGSAATLDDVYNRLIATDRMGHGSHLTDDEQNDLLTFLRSL
jgi:mono/diheme cytochrome c family protein